ncbi:PBECR2 nuclease fold domain-containing protein [Rhizobium sp. 9140]|uniref:PBECR2 nuclease fold domain-containing protein n=1 Tax=Rhizobium sp. 9140 TaxID=1761900 RepID=UPI0007935425|nr:PBECR2 nuclease fold domain-containing protein [Rhizobium sp. 9140]CZT32974.1 Phage Mu protein F like protein [Rhizobium sp. 9140]CZT36425.1 Phage Mu protein F like protein [Rhizobium sp. 9140]
MAGEQIPFQEAIDFVAGKVNLPTRRYDDLKHGAHVRGFSVAGVTRDDMLGDFRAAIEKARVQGTGFKEFQKDFDAIVDRTGWLFNARGSTDGERRAWRARIIYTTNMRTSYMAGRYKQLTDPDVLKYRPYWQYVHSGALHPRLQHLAWDGKVWAANDPIWDRIYPPNGWGCGCDVEALSRREMQALGKDAPDEAPELVRYDGIDPRTGEKEERIGGIGRGWEYNVGKEWLDGVVPTELREPLPAYQPDAPAPANLPDLPAPAVAKSRDLMPEGLEPKAYVEGFLKRFDLKKGEGPFRDKSGGLITISRSLFEQRMPDGTVVGLKSDKRGRGQYAKLLADTIIAPDEIWVDWAAMKSGVVLRRAYLKRIILPDGRALFVRFEWTNRGWVAVTGFDTKDDYLRNYRRGALLYRRPE